MSSFLLHKYICVNTAFVRSAVQMVQEEIAIMLPTGIFPISFSPGLGIPAGSTHYLIITMLTLESHP